MLVAKTASCRPANVLFFNQIKAKINVIWPKSILETAKISKKTSFLQRAPGVNGLKINYLDSITQNGLKAFS